MNFTQPQSMKEAATLTELDSFVSIATAEFIHPAAMRAKKPDLSRIKDEFGHCQIKKICYNSIEIH